MKIEESKIREALKQILRVERDHIFGVKTGSALARKRELEQELDKVLTELRK